MGPADIFSVQKFLAASWDFSGCSDYCMHGYFNSVIHWLNVASTAALVYTQNFRSPSCNS